MSPSCDFDYLSFDNHFDYHSSLSEESNCPSNSCLSTEEAEFELQKLKSLQLNNIHSSGTTISPLSSQSCSSSCSSRITSLENELSSLRSLFASEIARMRHEFQQQIRQLEHSLKKTMEERDREKERNSTQKSFYSSCHCNPTASNPMNYSTTQPSFDFTSNASNHHNYLIPPSSHLSSPSVTPSSSYSNLSSEACHSCTQPPLTEARLIQLAISLLSAHSAVPVGKLGSLLHKAAADHRLPQILKDRYGGLKKFLLSQPRYFKLGDNHVYNPTVYLIDQKTGLPIGAPPIERIQMQNQNYNQQLLTSASANSYYDQTINPENGQPINSQRTHLAMPSRFNTPAVIPFDQVFSSSEVCTPRNQIEQSCSSNTIGCGLYVKDHDQMSSFTQDLGSEVTEACFALPKEFGPFD